MAPLFLESQWVRYRSKFLAYLAHIPFSLLYLVSGLGSISLIYFMLKIWNLANPEWTSILLAKEKLSLTLPLFSFSLLAIWVPKRWLTTYWILAGLSSWFYFCFRQLVNPVAWFFIPALIYLGPVWIYFSARLAIIQKPILIFTMTVFAFLCAMYGIGWFAIHFHNEASLKVFWLAHPEYIFVLLMAYLFVYKSPSLPRQHSNQFLNPMNFFNPMPWKPEPTDEMTPLVQRQRLWIDGFIDVIQAQILILILFTFYLNVNFKQIGIPFLEPMGAYVPFLLLVHLIAVFTQGVSKMFGISISNLTEFIWLPRLPSEVWFRSNTHVFNLIFQGIYIPIFRKIRRTGTTLTFSLLIAFSIMFLFHELFVRWFYPYFFTEYQRQIWTPSPILIFALAWGLWWLLLFKISNQLRTWIYAQAQHQWIGIIITHLLNAYGFAFCSKWVPDHILLWINSPWSGK